MSVKTGSSVLAGLILMLAISMERQPAKASQTYPSEAYIQLEEGINRTWSASTQKSPVDYWDFVDVNVTVDPDGSLSKPEITHYSKNEQRNAECLEALCAFSPLRLKTPAERLRHEALRFGDGKLSRARFDGLEVKELLSSTTKPEVVIHRIPLSLLKTHLDMFSVAELRNKENLIVIPIGKDLSHIDENGKREKAPAYVAQIANYYDRWSKLLGRSDLTKQMVLDEAKRIGDKTE